ncbi:MAG: DUF192 domain-containing protein [Candidatus Paceibacterota bacterium]|jgi:hypothetical protein
MNKKYKFLIIILVVLCISLFFFFNQKRNFDLNGALITENIRFNIKIKDTNLKVDVADTPLLREKGLSGREKLEENEGMLFIFDYSSKHGFWMKDMNFAIDMVWLDEEQKIVHLEKNVSPESYPTVFSPKKDSMYVLEVISGFSDKNNLKTGDLVQFFFSNTP